MSREARATGREGVLAEVRELCAYFRALGDTLRLRLLRELAMQAEMSVSQLVSALRASQPLVSWHLAHLRRVGLVHVRRVGRQVYCSLDRAQLQHYQKLLGSFLGEAPEDEETQKHKA
jgi:DNA-binding transcriptional ArsR family regulator